VKVRNTVLASPYGPALGSKVKKNPASIAASGKIVNVIIRTAITWRCMEYMTYIEENIVNENAITNE
jgi:hypothetical protein